MYFPHQQKHLKDRRKDWQKQCINFSWSKCGTIATERTGEALRKRQKDFIASDQTQTKFKFH